MGQAVIQSYNFCDNSSIKNLMMADKVNYCTGIRQLFLNRDLIITFGYAEKKPPLKSKKLPVPTG